MVQFVNTWVRKVLNQAFGSEDGLNFFGTLYHEDKYLGSDVAGGMEMIFKSRLLALGTPM